MSDNGLKRVIVGIDGSDESMNATAVGHFVASQGKADFQLVHATMDLWVSARRAVTAAATSISASTVPDNDAALVESAHTHIAEELAQDLPGGVPKKIHVESGRAGPVLQRVAKDVGADLIVIGGKHHSILGRWLAGSTAHYLARNAPCPILVTASEAKSFSRVLVSLDLSEHAGTVLSWGEKLANAAHAALKVVHVAELEHEIDDSKKRLGALVRELTHSGTESTVVHGELWPTIQSEIRHWDADVLVVGSHGMGFENRQLLGRLAEECIEDLPTSTLIVPVLATT